MSTNRVLVHRRGGLDLTFDDLCAAVLATWLLLVTLPITFVQGSSSRMIAMIAVIPLGLGRLAQDARRGEKPAIAGSLVVVWVILASVAATSPLLALLGAYGREASGLIYIAAIAAWALGRRTSPGGRYLFGVAVIAALICNLGVSVLQLVMRRSTGALSLVDGRTFGLLNGPIYFGAVMAGGAALVSAWRNNIRRWAALGLIALFAGAANWSGSRFPVAIGLVCVVGFPAFHRRWRDAIEAVATYLVAVVVSTWVANWLTDSATATGRAGAEAAGRLDAWGYGLKAVTDSPIWGWGPGSFRPAVQGRFTADFTARHAQQELTQIWFDAHNIVIAVAVSLGVVGLVLCLAFVWLGARSAGGPLLMFAGAVGATWLLEPAGVATLPIAFLAFGVSQLPTTERIPTIEGELVLPGHDDAGVGEEAPAETCTTETEPPTDRYGKALALAGLAIASMYLLTNVRLWSAVKSGDPARVESAATWTPWDPVAANAVASAYVGFTDDLQGRRDALRWMEKARDRQPDWPFYYNKIAELRLSLNDDERARDELFAALELQPWNAQSLFLLTVVADRQNDTELYEYADERLCRIGAWDCD